MKTAKNDWTMKALLLGVAGLLATNLVMLSGVGTVRTAQAAGLPDSGAQLQAIIDEVKNVNTRLDSMQKFLEGGTMTVTVKADKDAK